MASTVAQAPMQPSRSDKAMPPVGSSATSAATSKTIVCTRHCPHEMRRSHWSIDQFVVAKKLGGGYASTVHLAICKATGMQVAIKVYHRCKLSQLNNYQVHREIRIHACLDHRNVLQLFAAFEDDVGVYLVTEYASRGDVFGELDRRGGSMTEADAVRQVLAPFLSALDYLHTLHIIHRDIKPENLLFTAAGVLKVADFGLSIDITQERPVTRVGTLDYMAPEVVICPDKVHPSDHKEKVHLHYTYLVDAWAVGVLAYELTVGRAPFDAGHKRGTIDNILHATPRYPAWVSDSARHFVGWSLTKDAAKRPGIQQLAEHPWIHQHAGAPAHTCKLVNPGRAVSCHNLGVQPVQTPQSPQHRHKLDSSSDVRLTHLQEEEEEVFVSAHGEGFHADAAAAKAAAAAALASGAKQPLPGGAVAITATSGSAAASPFGGASSQSPERGGGSPGSMLGAAADKLRAFVHRCQSANDLDGLKAFMMSQPPEPSNACFEPGGRFFSPSSGAQQQQQDAKAAAAVAGGKGSAHDSATSVSSQSHGSSSSSKPADLPRPSPGSSTPCSPQQQHVLKPLATPAAAACFGGSNGRPLQLIKLPQPGSSSRPDSCRSMQESPTGFTAAAAAAGIGRVGGSAYSNDVELMSPGSATPAGQQGGSPMAVSPAGALIRTTSAGTNADQPPRPFSTASTESCCSSSCDNAARDGSSICSSHSWGFGGHAADLEQQQPMQHSAAEMLPPRPHSPPRVGGANAAAKAVPSPPAAASHMQQQLQQQQHNSSKLGVAGPSAYSGADLHQLMQVCSSMPSGGGSLGEAAGAALAASKQALVSLSAECGGSTLPGDDQVQQEQAAAAMTINSCFGFLKTSARR